MRVMQSNEAIDQIQGSACCLLCGTLEDPFAGCEHQQEILFRSMEEHVEAAKELDRILRSSGYTCDTCGDTLNYADEVVFDGDETKVVDEQNPDWSHCTCNSCFFTDEEHTKEGVDENPSMTTRRALDEN